MSKIGNHRVEVQESESYWLGYKAAEEGRPQLPPADVEREKFRLGWQDYHDGERSL